MEPFTVNSSPRFDRLAEKLARTHHEFPLLLRAAWDILCDDPFPHAQQSHSIKKLANVQPGEGQYRLRLRRFRFRYDINGQDVLLHYCGLRREDTYR